MNLLTRGIRNAFRNAIRTVSLVFILGLSIGLALAMLVAYQAVGKKIDSVKSSIGNTVSISPAGVRGFEGGGNALTETQLASVAQLAHVTSLDKSLSDRLTTDNTSLISAIDAGSLGQRNAANSGQGFRIQNDSGQSGGPTMGQGSSQSGSASINSVTRTFTPPVTVVGTTSPTNLSAASSQGGGSFSLKSGRLFNPNSSDAVALVGSTLANKNNLKVGSTFTAYGKTVTVAGIFDAANSFSNNQVLMPLKTVQTLSSQSDAITSSTVNVDSISNVASVTTAVKKILGSNADVTNASTEAQQTITPLKNIQTISLYSLVGAVVAGAIIILLTMIMIVRERRREIGVLKAIGASNRTVVGQFTVEAVSLTLMAAVVGIGLGIAASNPITKLLVNNSTSATSSTATMGGPGDGIPGRRQAGALQSNLHTIHAVVGWDIILYGLGAALVIAIIGSTLASFFIAKIRPAEVLRTE